MTGRVARDLREGRRRGCVPLTGRGVRPGGHWPCPRASSPFRGLIWTEKGVRPGGASSVWLRLLGLESQRPGRLSSSPFPCTPIHHTPILSPSSQQPTLLSNFQPAKPYQPLSHPNSQPQIPAWAQLFQSQPNPLSPPQAHLSKAHSQAELFISFSPELSGHQGQFCFGLRGIASIALFSSWLMQAALPSAHKAVLTVPRDAHEFSSAYSPPHLSWGTPPTPNPISQPTEAPCWPGPPSSPPSSFPGYQTWRLTSIPCLQGHAATCWSVCYKTLTAFQANPVDFVKSPDTWFLSQQHVTPLATPSFWKLPRL